MGSSGSKPRKPNQRHLPKVGSRENRDYERRERQREVFGALPLVIVAVVVLALVLGLVVVT